MSTFNKVQQNQKIFEFFENKKDNLEEIQKTVKELLERSNENKYVLRNLKSKLNNNDEDKDLVRESIELVREEQRSISNSLRSIACSYITSEELKNDELRKEEEINAAKQDFGNDIILDKDSVVIENVEEKEEPIKVINITEKDLKNTRDDDVTEVLKKEKISEKELKNVKVLFDGTFKLIYDEGRKVYEQKKINKVVLDHNFKAARDEYNFNIISLLQDFDFENDTNLCDRYKTNDIEVEYDFNKKINKEDKDTVKKVRKLAKRELKLFKNVKIKDNRIKKFRKGLAFIATAGLLLFGGVNISKNINKNNSSPSVKTDSVISEAGQTDADIIEATTEVITTEETKIEEIDEKEVQTKEETKEEPIVEETKDSLKVGDTYNLNSTDLYYASTDNEARGNTSYINGDYCYKASLISVVYNNQVMQLVYNDSIDLDALETICKEKYGDNIKISINFDLVDKDGNVVTEHVGWVDKKDVLSKGKVLKK